MRFEEYLLEDVLDIKYGKNQKKVKDDNGPYPILGTGGLMGYATEYLYDKPSVLIGRKGSISKVRYIDEPFWTVDTLFYTIVNEEIVYPKFIYYYLSQIDFNYYNEGTTIPSLRTQTLNQIILNLPDLKYQAIILKMVNPIEERIELNNSIISNLEELAQTLFKRWFVDFEFPNEEGKPYKSSGGKMIESELGMIPEGWEVKFLNEVYNIKYGKNLPINQMIDSGYYVFGANGIVGYHDEFMYEDSQVIITCRGSGSGDVLKSRPYSFITNNSLIIEDEKGLGNTYTSNVIEVNNPYNYVTGSAQPQITVKNISKMKVILPNYKSIDCFTKVTGEIEKKIECLFVENENLINLRDTLLPKLLSGEIKLPDDMEVTDDVPIS